MKEICSLFVALLLLPLCAQTAPSISSIPERSTVESTTSSATYFTVGDAETPAEELEVSAVSADTTLVPNGNIILSGSGTSRNLTITPASGQRGSTTITLTVTDGDQMTASSAFVFTVHPRYVLPAETIPDIVMSTDGTLNLNYQMGNVTWTPSVTRTNTTLFRTVGTGSTNDLRLQGTGTHRSLRLRPAPGHYGESDVTLTITGDAGGPTESTFKVKVVPRAVADNLLGVADRSSTFNVLRNDTRPHAGTSIALQSFTQPANGTLTAGSIPGTLRYTPASGFTGNDTFTCTTIYNTGDTASATGYITVRNHLPIDAKHTDLRMNYVDGVWSNEVHAELSFGMPEAGSSSNPTILDFDEALLMVNPSSIITLPTTLNPITYSFIGKSLGEPIWNLPEVSKAGVLWPGFSSESIASGTFAAHTPTGDPRATANAVWIRVEMTGYRIPEGAVFSMYQSGPTVFWDSIDGVNGPDETTHGNNVSDTFWILTNSHTHINWTFTHPGRYEIDCRSKAFINPGGTLVEVTSPVNTLHFMVYGNSDPSTTGPLTEAPPCLQDDAANIAGNSGQSVIDVLSNDSSAPDSLETLAITAVTQPTHGIAAITPGGGSVTYSPAPAYAGPDSFTYTVTDEHGGSATAIIEVSVLPQTLAAWRQQHYGTTENSGIAANDQDPDGDGIENLLEYAFQLDPTASSSHLLPQASLVGGNFELSFTPPSVVSGISWGVEWSSSLQAADWHDVPNTGTASLHLYQVPVDGKERTFIRIRVSEP